MKTIRNIFIGLIILSGVIYAWKGTEIKRLLIVNSFFEKDNIVYNFSHIGDAFLSTPLSSGEGEPSTLKNGPRIEISTNVKKWIEARNVTSLLVIKDGQIRYEDYFLGTQPDDTRISWSVAKSFLSALMGVMLEEGIIESIDDPVVKYAPMLSESAYKHSTIKDVLQMSSGVVFNEDYLDKSSDINKMGRTLALGGSMDEFAANITESFAKPGEEWEYVSIDTHILGMVIRGASKRTIPDLMNAYIIDHLGFENHSFYVTDGDGVAFVLGGLNLTTRDYARFGIMFENDGIYNGKKIVSAKWIKESTTPSAKTAIGDYKYGYQWWMPKDSSAGEFLARGIYGQYMYINQPENIVIISTAADRNFKDEGVDDQNIDIFRELSAGL